LCDASVNAVKSIRDNRHGHIQFTTS